MMLLSHIEAWVLELERVVAAFEAAVDEVEEALDVAEEAGESREKDLQQVEAALENAKQVAGLVKAANAALNDAMEAARLVVTNEQLDLTIENREAFTTRDPTQPAAHRDMVGASHAGALDLADTLDRVGTLETTQESTLVEHNQSATRRIVAAELVPTLPASTLEPLPDGSIIIQGKYRLVQLLHQRPRVHLYLAQRLSEQQGNAQHNQTQQPLVAIRELVLADLTLETCKQIERAAFEEFASPLILGSPHLPGAGDRICIENQRHYLIMQLRSARGQRQAIAATLAELLVHQPQWPAWLDIEMALAWGMQLCRIVSRLHRIGVTLGDLNPATVLVDAQSAAEWSPVLLVSWPPPAQFWSTSTCSEQPCRELVSRVFPIAEDSVSNAFAAPEIFDGGYDERSDVYSLAAILYLLLTRYVPATAKLRLRAEQATTFIKKKGQRGTRSLRSGSGSLPGSEGMALIPPHLLNTHISSELEQVVARALSLNAGDRYPSVLAFAEALEGVNLEKGTSEPSLVKRSTQEASRIAKVIDWLRRELNE